MITDQDFERWRSLGEFCTKGPWRWWTSNSHMRLSSDPSGKDGDVLYAHLAKDGLPVVIIPNELDAKLLAESRRAIPALCAEVSKLRREEERLRREEELLTSLKKLHEEVQASKDDENSKLMAALRRYGRHDADCTEHDELDTCICGLVLFIGECTSR